MTQPVFSDSRAIGQRQIWLVVFGLGIVLIAVVAYFKVSDPTRRAIAEAGGYREVSERFDTPRTVASPEEAWIAESEARLGAQESALDAQKHQLEAVLKALDALKAGATQDKPAFGTLPPLPGPPPAKMQPPIVQPPPSRVVSAAARARGVDRVETFDSGPRIAKIIKAQFSRPQEVEDDRRHIRDTIPAASFARAVMLSGLDAPTGNLGQKNPHPVGLQLVDLGNLPNRFVHRVRECRVIAAGHGELSDERAYLRLERLSCVLRDGSVMSQAVKGFVTGEDGKNGLAGRLIEKRGALLGRAMLAGLFSGLGKAIGQSFTNVSTSALGTVETIDPGDLGKAGLAEGAGTAMEKVSEWYLERADEIFPVIEVDAGRVVTLWFSEDVDLGVDMFKAHTAWAK